MSDQFTGRFVRFLNGLDAAKRTFLDKFFTPISANGTSQQCYSMALIMHRSFSPENLAMSYNEDERIKLLETGVKKENLNWVYPIRVTQSGMNHKETSDSFDYYWYNQKHHSSKVEDTLDWMNKHLKDSYGATGLKPVYAAFRAGMRGLTLAIAIECRKRDMLVYAANKRINGEEIRTGKTAPWTMDFINLPPSVARSLPHAMKAPGALVAEWDSLSRNRNLPRDLKLKLIKRVEDSIKTKLGTSVANLIFEAQTLTIALREVQKAAAAVNVNHHILQFPDLVGFFEGIRTGDPACLTTHPKGQSVIGFNFADPQVCANYSIACATTTIFMPSALSGVPHRVTIKFQDGLQGTTNSAGGPYFVPIIPDTDTGFTSNGPIGQNTGYNPTKGANCLPLVMTNAQSYLTNMTKYEATNGNSLAALFQNKIQSSRSNKVTGIVTPHWDTVVEQEPQWDDFFLTTLMSERQLTVKRSAPTETKGKGKSGTFSKKARYNMQVRSFLARKDPRGAAGQGSSTVDESEMRDEEDK